jgi:hypothetical protein
LTNETLLGVDMIVIAPPTTAAPTTTIAETTTVLPTTGETVYMHL